jgi:hypothetical protein
MIEQEEARNGADIAINCEEPNDTRSRPLETEVLEPVEETVSEVAQAPSRRGIVARACWLCLSSTTAVVIVLATFQRTLNRRVTGAFPKLIHDIFGVQWDTSFSLWSLGQTVGAAGGWDNMLMGTFLLFVVVGPIVRTALCLLPRRGKILQIAIDFIGAFCAWEVIALACYLVSLLIPSTTATIINRPICDLIDPNGTCLEVFFDTNKSFDLILVGGVMLVFVARLPYVISYC